MNLFNFFRMKRKDSAYYIKLRRILLRSGFINGIKNAYFLFGLPSTPENFERLKTAKSSNSFKHLKETIHFDVKVDNLELYLI